MKEKKLQTHGMIYDKDVRGIMKAFFSVHLAVASLVVPRVYS